MFQDAWIPGYCRVNQETRELYCKIYHQHYCWKIYWFLLCMSVFLFAVIRDMKTFYLFLYNLFQWIGFSYIFITIMYRYLSYGVGMYNMPSFITPGLPSVLWRCWLGGRKGIQPVKNWVVRCRCGYLSGARCWHIWPSWCHCHSLSLAPVKSRLVLPFWYRLTQVVLDKGPLNGCVCLLT